MSTCLFFCVEPLFLSRMSLVERGELREVFDLAFRFLLHLVIISAKKPIKSGKWEGHHTGVGVIWWVSCSPGRKREVSPSHERTVFIPLWYGD
jgi:hypothetical protein